MSNRNENKNQIYCIKCRDYHDVNEVKHHKIEEEYQGNETLFFTCPISKELVSSIIYKAIK